MNDQHTVDELPEADDPVAYPHHPARPAWSQAPVCSVQTVPNHEADQYAELVTEKARNTVPSDLVIRPRKLVTRKDRS